MYYVERKHKIDGWDAAPTNEEARSLLEKRKHAEVPSHVERGEPPKKKKKTTTKKKAKSPSPAVAKKPAKPVELEDAKSSSPQGSNTVQRVMLITERRPVGSEK